MELCSPSVLPCPCGLALGSVPVCLVAEGLQCTVAGIAYPMRTANSLNGLIGKEIAEVKEKNLFDMQAKNMLTELQTTEGSAIKIILIHR